MRQYLAAIFGVMLLVLFCPYAEGASHIPNGEIQVFGTYGWGGPQYGDPANTLDEDLEKYWNGTDGLSNGETNYLAYKFNTQYCISQIEFYGLEHLPYYFMGELDIQISQNSTDGLDGDWTTVDHIDGDFEPGSRSFTRTLDTPPTYWVRLWMEYQGRGAWGGSPAFYLNEIDFYGDTCDADDLYERVEALESAVEELLEKCETLEQRVMDLEQDFATHRHLYLTGEGKGHNSTEALTGEAE
jgi:hypothetical protein